MAEKIPKGIMARTMGKFMQKYRLSGNREFPVSERQKNARMHQSRQKRAPDRRVLKNSRRPHSEDSGRLGA
jgi:hypothetical protein